VLRKVSCLAALLLVTLPAAPDAQQFGGARRVEVSSAYPYAAVGKWTCGDGGSRTVCTAFLAGSFQFETSDGQRFQVRNVRADHSDKSEAKPEEPDLDVAFGQIAARSGPPPGEKYGRFAFDDADTVAASSGFTAHCSFGFSHNEEGKGRRGTLDPDVYVWGSLRRLFPAKAPSDEFLLHMTNGVYGASGSPIFRCVPNFSAGKLLGIDVSAPARVAGLHPVEQ
jgi:hypothetical protein